MHGVGAIAPDGQNPPAEQGSHTSSPSLPWKVPLAQGVHSGELSLGATEPAAHGVGAIAPREHAWPAGQAWQPPCDVSPVTLPNVPSAHASALAPMLPAGQKKPRAHSPEHAASGSSVSLP